ncbi:MAG TPA: SGNH/GDSL hydrolase family protein [Kiritimatiellia bacterium]|jgi:lysophospholipase L1-like esterase|nr:hypothetical protein [Kiritimatiellia bacterium]OQC57789.1 MAG: multifunctional acyl-CoA thioesterase I and protease I and lysophospholipase L1 [Verrucomicrobia bacterium ADurb.Bin018]MBP9573059.1 hypothetical protein [Kiritimatiellia bacterium]HOE00050.1 SGNH/GDSL hydrolase family protein [Kiritimatiellia bacterium]HOE36696.1 SGNH/GDSL hydrolase family protein [Kiritimatiellia bacterium]
MKGLRGWFSMLLAVVLAGLLIGCGGGDDKISNPDPGSNDLNVIVAFGDSITKGSECPCAAYPPRLAALTGKVVHNAGIGGSRATGGVGRTKQVINKYHPAFMLILYGVNDVIHSYSRDAIIGALDRMVTICQENHVVPVLATYPMPIHGHRFFAGSTVRLNQAIRDLAAARNIRCVDLEREFATGYDHSDPNHTRPIPDPSLYMPDGLHPNDAGTQVMAMAFADLF